MQRIAIYAMERFPFAWGLCLENFKVFICYSGSTSSGVFLLFSFIDHHILLCASLFMPFHLR